MMLRASIDAAGDSPIDLRAVTGEATAEGVADGDLLVRFAEAAVRREEALPRVRNELADRLGEAALVDAAGTVANFQRMVRIADGTGIPLDTPMRALSSDFRDDLHLDRFASAANTPRDAWPQRVLQFVVAPVARRAVRFYARRSGRR